MTIYKNLFFKLTKINWIIYLVLILVIFNLPVFIKAISNQIYNQFLVDLYYHFSYYKYYYIILLSFFMFFSYFQFFKKKRIFFNVNDLEQLKNLSWQDFEVLTGQIMRHLKYKVQEQGGAQADGGIDLIAYKNNSKYIIQCKHWKANKIGVKIVREMFGVSIHENANGVYIFTTGDFTKEARDFAKEKKVYLVNGYQICKLISQIKNK